MKKLEGRVAVVTGAASGIGLALSRRFRGQGMRVVMADVEQEALERAADAVRALPGEGGDVVAVPTDVTRSGAVQALAETALDAFEAVHVVCNNAGVFTGGLSWEAPLEDWEWVMGVNLWGVIHGIRSFVPILLEQDEAHLVNTASMAGVTATPLTGIYNMTKHAVVSLSETLALELQSKGPHVGVSVVCPEAVRTGIAGSGRNRPEDLAVEAPRSQEQVVVEAAITAAAESGIDPDVIAGRALDAIRESRFWVLAEDDFWRASCLRRLDDIRHGRNPGFEAPEGYED